ncbi:sulfite exporter TauE/SafE family protein [Desulfonema ishimotonii]|uniref:Probable membrane transporter protein n=2 Tax=Desulfonema ishimotonii TaxID=45657 RepID=A0A401G283_9BACT|nr:sulfite exporter TauE/SafE family protein [Desulfonema ishimotonii]
MYSILLTYSAAGAVAGVLAGLLGIGGGLVIVPMLVFCFTWQQLPHDLIMHMALGTSMASIIFTSVSSFRAHHKRGAVRWIVVRRIVLGIFLGTFLGSCVAARLSTNFLKGFFVLFLYYVATQMLINRKPEPSRQIPGKPGMFGVGNVIGAFSSLVGIGGGTLSVPFMIWCNLPVHHAIGTSAAIGFPIAIAGTVGYIYNGWHAANLPEYSVGYVYLPALVGLVCVSIFTAPLGVRLAHSLPVDRLKRVFAILLLIVATRMLISLF